MKNCAIYFAFILSLTSFSLFASYPKGNWQRPVYPNYYYPNYYYYDPLYTPYQPDNGPMRGPNSIEGHRHRAYE